MMRSVSRWAGAVGITIVLFALMQLFERTHCIDCGAMIGFPFSYMQDGTYWTHGHFIWLGFLGDLTVATLVPAFAALIWRRKAPK